jgi:hypothetical protein
LSALSQWCLIATCKPIEIDSGIPGSFDALELVVGSVFDGVRWRSALFGDVRISLRWAGPVWPFALWGVPSGSNAGLCNTRCVGRPFRAIHCMGE